MEKTIKTMLALMAGVLTFSACTSNEFANTENINGNGAKRVALTAYQEGDGATSRAAIGTTSEGSTTINWKSGDAIGVFASTGSSTKFTTSTNDATSATFWGQEVTDAAYALYPYQSTATISEGVITAEIPMTQYAVEGSFDPKAALMVGTVSNDGSVQFKNVMSFVKVTVPEGMTQCKQITVKAKDEWITLAGKVKITVATAPTWAETDDKEGQAFVRLVPQSGSTYLTANKTYYIAVLPQTMTSGFEIIYNVNDDIYCKQTTKSDDATKNFYRNKVKNIGSLSTADTYYTYKATTTTFTAPGTPSTTVKFADFNIGAAETNAYGDYLAWGALRPLYTTHTEGSNLTDDKMYKSEGFIWINAPFYTGDGDSNHSWSQYNSSDNKTKLEATDDIVAMLWGGNWCMPEIGDFNTLLNACGGGTSVSEIESTADIPTAQGVYYIKKRDAIYTVSGILFVQDNTHCVFFPDAGMYKFKDFTNNFGRYWSSSINSDKITHAWRIGTGPNYANTAKCNERYFGFSVRPVLVQ